MHLYTFPFKKHILIHYILLNARGTLIVNLKKKLFHKESGTKKHENYLLKHVIE